MKRALFLVLLCVVGIPCGASETVALTILHTNDTHGHLLPFRYPAMARSAPGLDTLPTGVELGGIARRATLAKRIRDEQATHGIPVWLVDAGDISEGTAFSVEYHGQADVEAMAAAGYTLGTLGNHELNLPLASLRELIAKTSYPWLCANAVVKATGQPLVAPSLVREVGPLRVGVFGLLTRDAADYPAARDGLTVEDEIVAARRSARELRSRADVVVVVSHAGKKMDEQIAAAVPEIDVIVGGHSHSRLPSGELIWRARSLAVDDVGGTVIVQAHQWGGELGRLDLLFDKDAAGHWRVARYRAELIPVTADIPEDPQVAAVVERFWQPIATRYSEVVGRAADDFVTLGRDQAEYNLMADAMRAMLGTEIHIESQGGVRAPLSAGPITLADVVTMDPFSDTVVTFRISGHDLARVLAELKPAVSGLRYRVEGKQLTHATVAGRKLDPQRVYWASTQSYVARRVLAQMLNVSFKDTGRTRRDTLVEYIRARRTIHPAYDGRREIIAP